MRHQRTSLLCPLISIFRKCTSLSVVPVGKIIPPRQSQKGQREQGHLVGQACPLGGVRGQELSSAADPGGHAGSGWAALPTTTTHTGHTGSVLPDHPLCVSRALRRTYFLPLSFLSTPKMRLQWTIDPGPKHFSKLSTSDSVETNSHLMASCTFASRDRKVRPE